MLRKILPPIKNVTVRDTLFGDQPLDYWTKVDSKEIPWNLFKAAKVCIDKGDIEAAIETFKQILEIEGLETRQYLQAFHFLHQLNALPESTVKVLGTVVEVAMDDGTDLLAVYADHSARYYNYAGSAVIWDAPDMLIANKIDHILVLAKDIVAQTDPWEYNRPSEPRQGCARINLLTSHGLHFGEADQIALYQDVTAGKIMYAMLDMMETLTTKVLQNKKAS